MFLWGDILAVAPFDNKKDIQIIGNLLRPL